VQLYENGTQMNADLQDKKNQKSMAPEFAADTENRKFYISAKSLPHRSTTTPQHCSTILLQHFFVLRSAFLILLHHCSTILLQHFFFALRSAWI